VRIPVATYRLQFHKGFTFEHARALLPYLRDLGISDVYSSPIFLAGPESTHGYDICGFDQINPNLGSQDDFDKLTGEIRGMGMGLLVDMVPNHMGSHQANCWWIDVLKKGPGSNFSAYFDIDWNPPNPLLKGKVLLPVLGDHYNTVLERGELKLIFEFGSFYLAYFDKRFPVSAESESAFLSKHLNDSNRAAFLAEINGHPGIPASFGDLHRFIDLQHYRLAYWRVGPHEINYRRFFDVTELVSVRVESDKVFQDTHRFLFDLMRTDQVTGLRIDHPDGLRDPIKYFLSLHSHGKIYVLAEKILSDTERLPEDWPIHGTTGYDYLVLQNALFVQSENEAAFTEIYKSITGSQEDFSTLAFRSKQDVLDQMFIAEVNALTTRLKTLSTYCRVGRDFTYADFHNAIIDFIAAFPVYRTYLTEQTSQLSFSELKAIEHGLAEAKKRSNASDAGAIEFLARILSLSFPPDFSEAQQSEAREFIIRFQQLSGPATAKGLEDTAFYRYARFVSLNEVGGNPGQFGISPREFHVHNLHNLQKWPHSMLATSTHDTKRGEDTRARLNVLSEMPSEWHMKVSEWMDLNKRQQKDSAPAPSDEYLLYQVLVGTWTSNLDLPAYIERIQGYMLKATREAKNHTAWTEPNAQYESATKEFIASVLSSSKFTESLSAFAEGIAFFGALNSIAQVVLKCTSPGIPDFYQGTEHWDLTLVDPDNRRPVDYELRKKLLAEVRNTKPAELLKDWQSGAIKTFTVAHLLRIRREHPPLRDGDYNPIEASGLKSNHIIAFSRTTDDSTILVAVPRFHRTLTQEQRKLPEAKHWGDTHLKFPAANRFENLFTGEQISGLAAADLFATFPAAILRPLL
jgi:(1->4)-alpha-D-glucan 1-alpha-D-glucosylmutase